MNSHKFSVMFIKVCCNDEGASFIDPCFIVMAMLIVDEALMNELFISDGFR